MYSLIIICKGSESLLLLYATSENSTHFFSQNQKKRLIAAKCIFCTSGVVAAVFNAIVSIHTAIILLLLNLRASDKAMVYTLLATKIGKYFYLPIL